MPNLGLIFFAVSIIFQGIAIGVAVYRALKRRPYVLLANVRIVNLSTVLLNIAGIWLLMQLLGENYRLSYVSQVVNDSMSIYERAMAYWAGTQGSLFIWVWSLQSATMFAMVFARKQLFPETVALMQGTAFIFALHCFFIANPFSQVWVRPDGLLVDAILRPVGAQAATFLQGTGMDPNFRHSAMAFHPPLIFLGFAAFMPPAAITAALRLRGQIMDRVYIMRMHSWNMVGWVLLLGGLLSGAWWASQASIFGHYWTWDPIQTAALLPFLSSTAQMHTNLSRRTRDRLTVLDTWHILLTWILVLFATYVARSPAYNSAHYFGERDISTLFLVILLFTLFCSIGLMVWRWKTMGRPGGTRRMIGRDSLLFSISTLLTIFILISIATLLLPRLGIAKPLVESPVFKSAMGTGLLLFALLLGFCPVLSYGFRRLQTPLIIASTGLGTLLAFITWRYYGQPSLLSLFVLTTAFIGISAWLITWLSHRYFRSWRRTAAGAIHLGVLLMVVGVTGVENFSTNIEQQMQPGDQLSWGNYTLSYYGNPVIFSYPDHESRYVPLSLSKGGGHLADLAPQLDIYPHLGRNISEADSYDTFWRSTQVVLEMVRPTDNWIKITVKDKPLESLIWVGGILLLVAGALMALRRHNRPAQLPGDPPLRTS